MPHSFAAAVSQVATHALSATIDEAGKTVIVRGFGMLRTIRRSSKFGTVGTVCATTKRGCGCDDSSGCEDFSDDIESNNQAGLNVYDDERVLTPGAPGSVQSTGVRQLPWHRVSGSLQCHA
jgi:hypothetical protein